MEQLGVDEVYIDRMRGKNTNRPELQKMMEYVLSQSKRIAIWRLTADSASGQKSAV